MSLTFGHSVEGARILTRNINSIYSLFLFEHSILGRGSESDAICKETKTFNRILTYVFQLFSVVSILERYRNMFSMNVSLDLAQG